PVGDMILVGDIGGTKTRLARYELRDKKFVRLEVETFASREFGEFHETLELFLGQKNSDISQVCFGVPGPIIAGEAQATNLPWRMEEKAIAKILNVPRVKLVNDLVATASAIPYLSGEDLRMRVKALLFQPRHELC
ncbi:MAG: glucokinase, partial [bacterium]